MFSRCNSLKLVLLKGQTEKNKQKSHDTVVWVNSYVYELKQWPELAILLCSSC